MTDNTFPLCLMRMNQTRSVFCQLFGNLCFGVRLIVLLPFCAPFVILLSLYNLSLGLYSDKCHVLYMTFVMFCNGEYWRRDERD